MNTHAIPPEGTVLSHEGNGHHAYSGETYYGVPPVKHSSYHWMIAASYFSIGTAAASQVLSTVLDLVDAHDKGPMVRSGRYAALAGSLVTPALYIIELGAPRKWYTMLRIYRPSSLMSLGGVWVLTAFGAASGAVALGQVLEDAGYVRTGSLFARSFSLPAALAGAFLSMYMGTELEETSTPLWAETSPLLSSLFGLNNASNAIALFELTGDVAHVAEETIRPLRFLALLAEAANMVQLRRVELRWTRSAALSPRYRSRYDLLYLTGLVTLARAAGLILRAAEFIAGERFRNLRPIASAASLAAGAALPWILIEQGNRSADTARDYFEYTSPVPQKRLAGTRRTAGKGQRPGPPRSLSMLKWLAVSGLALGTFALFMKPKKAY